MSTTVKKTPTLKKTKYNDVETVYHIDSGLVFRSMQDRTVVARLVNGEFTPMNKSFIELAQSNNFKYEIQEIPILEEEENEEEEEGEENDDEENENENEDEEGEENDNEENDNEEENYDEEIKPKVLPEPKVQEEPRVQEKSPKVMNQVNLQPPKVNPELTVNNSSTNINEISLLFANHISELHKLENLVNQKLNNSDNEKRFEEELKKCRIENESLSHENSKLKEQVKNVTEMYEALNLKFTTLKKLFA